MTGPHVGAEDPRVDRAVRLFEFLGRVQQLKANPPRTTDTYERDGAVLWLADLPQHPAVWSAGRGGDPEQGDPLLTVDRVSHLEPPVPTVAIMPWLEGEIDDPDHRPTLRESIAVPVIEPTPGSAGTERLEIEDHPEVQGVYDTWLVDWQAWADQELADRPARRYYGDLFSTYVSATTHPEELELVVALGCLVWTPPGRRPVRRHLLTVPATIHFDDESGRLTVIVAESADGVTVELDMLEPELTNSSHINEARFIARAFQAHPLHREEVGSLARRLVHTLDADGVYLDEDSAPHQTSRATAAFAPAVILRKRSQQGLVDIYRGIVAQIAESGVVPDGVVPLVDPDHRPHTVADATPGAAIRAGDELYLPLPVNDVQRRIVQQVDRQAQTLVQGPPGTGKTHTAAALLSHLLAQGKRVLVTAHTDRALKEVRDKLPATIKPLSVAIVGSSQKDMSDLKVAVERIAAAAAEHDARGAERAIHDCLAEIDRLADDKANLYRTLLDAREGEVAGLEHAGYRGTLAAIAQQHQSQSDRLAWLADYLQVPSHSEAPDDLGIVEWRGHLLSADLAADEAESRRRLADPATVREPDTFADLVAAEQVAVADDERHAVLRTNEAFAGLASLGISARADLKKGLHEFVREAGELARRSEGWINDALTDVLAGRGGIWRSRGQQITELIEQTRTLVADLGPTTSAQVTRGDTPMLAALATELRDHLDGGGKIKLGPAGIPKVGPLSGKAVRQAQPLFDSVRVNGLPPATVPLLNAFLVWSRAEQLLEALDRAWPDNVRIPAEDTLAERLQWHITECDQLRRVLSFDERWANENRRLAERGLPKPDWRDRSSVERYMTVVDAVGAHEGRVAAEAPIRELEDDLVKAARWTEGGPCVHELLMAVRRRDHNAYATAWRRLVRLHEVREIAARRDALGSRLKALAPSLFEAIIADPAGMEWDERLAAFNEAWRWASTATWIREQSDVDINVVQHEINQIETRIRGQVETLAATRAWNHAVSPDRLPGKARADLTSTHNWSSSARARESAARRAEIRRAWIVAARRAGLDHADLPDRRAAPGPTEHVRRRHR